MFDFHSHLLFNFFMDQSPIVSCIDQLILYGCEHLIIIAVFINFTP